MITNADVLVVDERLLEAQTTLVAFEQVAPRARVLHLFDGGEALEYLFSTGTFAGRAPKMPQLVFLSLEMQPISGLCVLDLMRAHPLTSSVPVVLVSLERNARIHRRHSKFDADAYVTLPFDFGRYCAIVGGCAERWLPWALRPWPLDVASACLSAPARRWDTRAHPWRPQSPVRVLPCA